MNAITGLYGPKLAADRARLAEEREGRANREYAARHLAMMEPVRRALLEADWVDGEASVSSVNHSATPEQKARADAEWLSQPTLKGE